MPLPLLKPAVPTPTDEFVELVGRELLHLLQEEGFSDSAASDKWSLLLSLSGGPDSMALLAALCALRTTHNIQPHAFHINHALRQAESDADEEFCRSICAHWSVPFSSSRLDGSVVDEDGLRRLRYRHLENYAEDQQIGVICTGHSLDDQIETLFFRLFRGTAAAGLTGIPVKRRTGRAKSLLLIRPMLTLSRQEIAAFNSRSQIPSRFDSSNASSDYTRNYIRNEIIPLVSARFPGFTARVESFRRGMTEDEQLLQALAENALATLRTDAGDAGVQNAGADTWGLSAFLQQPPSLQRRLIVMALQKFGVQPSHEIVKRVIALARAPSPQCLSLDQFWEVRSTNELLNWRRREAPSDRGGHTDALIEQIVALPGTTLSPELGASISINSFNDAIGSASVEFPSANSYETIVDLSNVEGPFILRKRRPGDQLQPFGMQEMVRLKKFLHTHKSKSLDTYGEIVVLANAHEVLWVPGFGISEKLRVTGTPTHCLQFELLRCDGLMNS